MYSTSRIGAIVVLGIGGLLITFVPATLESRVSPDLIMILAIAGAVFLSSGRLWFEKILTREGDYDDRWMIIRYRSGWVVAWVLLSTIWAIWSIEFFTEMRLPQGWFALLGTGGIVLQGTCQFLLKRWM